jgi:hypothetical protein
MSKTRISLIASAVLLALGATASQSADKPAQQSPMTFFITSAGSGKGGDLGGLAGADKHCQDLATAAGAGKHTWHAYLSTTGAKPVNARDRIGKGPWHNARGKLIARNLDELHSANGINKESALNEKGGVVNGRGDSPNQHDMLTGSTPDGRASTDGKGDTTCGNWTSSSAGSAIVGHHDRQGLSDTEAARSWNSSHPSKGCSQENLVSTGGAGLFYCFAAR